MNINQDLVRRYEQCKSERSNVENDWDLIERYVTPYRGGFFENLKQENSVDWRQNRDTFDSTAIRAHKNLAASIHGSVTNPGLRWFNLSFRNQELQEDQKALKWLNDCSELIFNSLQDSNFNVKINEAYLDLVGFGTTVMVHEEAPKRDGEFTGMEFHSVPLRECFFEVDHRGMVLRFYRKREWTPQQILSKFSSVPEWVREADEAGDTDKLDVLYCISPRNNRIVPVGEHRYPAKRPWDYRYILLKTMETIDKPGGFYEMPVYAPRWLLTTGSVWGNSPSHEAMPDIQTLNDASQMRLVAMEKLIDPPILGEDGALVTDLDLSAAAYSVVRDVNGLKPFETRADISAMQLTVGDLRERVEMSFLEGMFSFPSPQAQPMTATEAQIRYDLIQRLLSGTLERLQTELLGPIVGRTFRMLARAGKIPKPPIDTLSLDSKYDTHYTGPLVRSQLMDLATSTERFISSITAIGMSSPAAEAAMDHIDYDAAPRVLQRYYSIPPDILRSKKDAEAVRKKREDAKAAMNEAVLAQEQGAAAQAGATPQ